MKHISLFLLFCCISYAANAQATFQKKIPFLSRANLACYDDGSLLLGGAYSKCSRLCKLNPQGDVSWTLQTCPNTAPTLNESHWIDQAVIMPNQEAWVLVTDNLVQFTKHYVNRLDANGNILWSSSLNLEISNLYSPGISADLEGNLWVGTSYNTHFTDTDNITHSEFEIFRVDAVTNAIWRKKIVVLNPNGERYSLRDIYSASPDNTLIYGTIQAGLEGFTEGRGFMACFDRNGQVKWSNTYGKFIVYKVKSQFANGDFLASGFSEKAFALARMKQDGSIVWIRRKIEQPNGRLWGGAYLSLDKQSIWITADANEKTETLQDTTMLYKLDTVGNLLWGKGYWRCKYSAVHVGAPTPDNGFALMWRQNINGSDILTKVNADGLSDIWCQEQEGNLFKWETPVITIKPFQLVATNGTLTVPETLAWDTITNSTSDFCPDDIPEAYFETSDSVCLGTPLQLLGYNPVYSDRFRWDIPAGIPQQVRGLQDSVIFNGKGLQEIRLIHSFGFCIDTFEKNILVVGLDPLAIADTVLCDQSPLSVDVSLPDALSYTWNDGDTSPIRIFNQAGLYTVSASDGACTQQSSFNLTYFSPPDLFLAADTTACQNGFFTPPAGPSAVAEWRWNGLPTAPPFEWGTTDGLRILEATFTNGCLASDSIQVHLINCSDPDIYIPNAVSFRDNSVNRIFEIFAPNVIPVQSALYNRWGELLYSTGPAEWPQWDGNFRGHTAAGGVYLFVCKLKFPDGTEKTFARDVTVVP